MDIRKKAEKQWAQQKYEVMAKSYRYYSSIRDRFREAKEEKDYLAILEELNWNRYRILKKDSIIQPSTYGAILKRWPHRRKRTSSLNGWRTAHHFLMNLTKGSLQLNIC